MKTLAKLAFWAFLIFFVAATAAILLVPAEAQEPPPMGNPQFIVVWSIPEDDSFDGNPFVDLRVVIRAENEWVAVSKSTMFLYDKLPSHIMRRMKLVEVAARKPQEKK